MRESALSAQIAVTAIDMPFNNRKVESATYISIAHNLNGTIENSKRRKHDTRERQSACCHDRSLIALSISASQINTDLSTAYNSTLNSTIVGIC